MDGSRHQGERKRPRFGCTDFMPDVTEVRLAEEPGDQPDGDERDDAMS